MAPKTDKNGQIQKREQKPQDKLIGLVRRMGPEITRALPKHVTADRMARIVMTAIRSTPKLAECSPESFLGSVMQCAQLGLEPNTPLGHAYLLPYWNKNQRSYECSLITGYQGMIELAMRSGRVSSIFAHAVRECDHFRYELGLNPTVEHIPADIGNREEIPISYVYAVARIKDADPVFVVMSKAQVDARRARSASGKKGFSPWETDYEAMALKTAVRTLFKWMPKSSEIARVEVLETTAELGTAQFNAFDPDVGAALEKHGLLPEDVINGEVVEEEPKPTNGNGGKPQENYDPETGEVFDGPSDEELGLFDKDKGSK